MPKPLKAGYAQWARENIDFDPDDPQFRRRFAGNVQSLQTTIEQSDAWSSLGERLPAFADRYREERGFGLFTGNPQKPGLLRKSIESAVEKTFRINVLENQFFPNPPYIKGTHQWLVEDNLYRILKDLVRCRIVCRYMDGPEYLCSLVHESMQPDLDVTYKSMESDLGYYSWHLSIPVTAGVMKSNGNIVDENARYEVQITTQLQDVLNDLTHAFYEDKRIGDAIEPIPWRWRPHEAKFQGVYFGHTLHMLEGMLVELKRKILKDQHDD
ncbi:hypothetical protein [Mesorhizobium sp.]|uniref:hypothetical protein n=1 Tax=Mesorhizobium sp. TaxID=1871066 RepID=UPI000FE5AE81|nr:hypothetical protein [Mesorhizobium sp.]RWK30803.1 MAG: hypothetical protein EOR46_31555 [Mesorhizobium sp.]RWK60841.1 MAG: hypothetical protein EOR54_33940 [Mesorhizobium sp.]RWK69591.1 MAG: hypothetical protein EOR50_34710 [Mesorhizobium sp.]RWK74058.1 MAG: hypothetical protein EOR51_34605 [Mesorhizobium sp.]RWK98665.1 MAG: hypothetical protein EOR55_34695 [Mesorhizobium sp.]